MSFLIAGGVDNALNTATQLIGEARPLALVVGPSAETLAPDADLVRSLGVGVEDVTFLGRGPSVLVVPPVPGAAPPPVVVVADTGGNRRRRERLPAPVQPKPKGPWRKRQKEAWVDGAPVPAERPTAVPAAPALPPGAVGLVGVGVVAELPPLVALPALPEPWGPAESVPFAAPEPWAPPVQTPDEDDEAVSLLLMASIQD